MIYMYLILSFRAKLLYNVPIQITLLTYKKVSINLKIITPLKSLQNIVIKSTTNHKVQQIYGYTQIPTKQ